MADIQFEYNETATSTNYIQANNRKQSQSFLVGDIDHTITAVRFKWNKQIDANTIGTVDVKLYAADGSGLPTGSVLASGTYDGNSLTTTSAIITVTLGTPYTCLKNNSYVWTVEAENTTSGNGITNKIHDSSVYSGGTIGFNDYSGGAYQGWTAYTRDMWFQNLGVPAGYLTEYEGVNTDGGASANIYGVNWGYQTFTPSTNHRIKYVALTLYTDNASPGTITVSIRAAAGNKPTGSDLCSGTYDGSLLTLDVPPYPSLLISLGTGTDLTASTMYSIVVRATTGDATHSVRWRISGAYSGGSEGYSGDSGSTWTENAATDAMFREFGVTPTDLSTTLPTGNLSLSPSFKVSQLSTSLTLPTGNLNLEGLHLWVNKFINLIIPTANLNLSVGNLLDTIVNKCTNLIKHNADVSNLTKHNAGITNLSKNDASITNSTKHSSSPTNLSKNNATITNQSKNV